jgi:hypothetical protein
MGFPHRCLDHGCIVTAEGEQNLNESPTAAPSPVKGGPKPSCSLFPRNRTQPTSIGYSLHRREIC